MANTDSTTTSRDDELDKIYDSVMSCKALINEQEVNQLADLVFSKERVIRSWRLAAWLAGKGGPFYQDLSTNASVANELVPSIGAMDETSKLLREMADIIDTVSTRVAVAGCNHERLENWTH